MGALLLQKKAKNIKKTFWLMIWLWWCTMKGHSNDNSCKNNFWLLRPSRPKVCASKASSLIHSTGACYPWNLFRVFLGLNAETPQVSYVKAIDVWMGACTAFIFSALLEFTVVNYLSRRRTGCCGNPVVNASYHLRNGHHHCNQVLLLLKCN